jgi:hypothetical protein
LLNDDSTIAAQYNAEQQVFTSDAGYIPAEEIKGWRVRL